MQVGEIRPATVDDFKQLLDIVFSHEGWESKPDKGGVKVWTKSMPSSPVKMIKLAVDFDDMTALTLYDVLHDPDFRPVWDESMIEGLDIYKIDDFNDIGYYSLRCPRPLKNRDFVNQRSWGIFGDDHMIMNHTIDIEEMPVKKDFVRGVSYLTGYVVKKTDTGCSVHYITQNDPGGQVPKFILDKISCVIAPKVLEKIHKAALGYEEWKSKNRPEYRPWRGLGNDSKPMWPKSYQSCKASNSTPALDTDKVVVNTEIPALATHNGRVEADTAPPSQYGSLNSLAQPRVEDTPTQDPVSPVAEEIISNVFNVGDVVQVSDTPAKPPLVRHESITILRANDEEGAVPGANRHNEHRRSLLVPTKSMDYSHLSADPTRPGIQQNSSLERTTQPISSTMNHMTSRENDHIPRDNNHVSHDHSQVYHNSVPIARETGGGNHDYRIPPGGGYHDTRTPGQYERMAGMQRTDSVDTAGSQISELCYSLSQLTKGGPGTEGAHPARPGSTTSSRALVPPGTFASVTMAAHPIDPDCCTRVSRHVMGAYGGRNTPARAYTPNSAKFKPHKQKVATIHEKTEHRVKKSSKDPEGLESSSLKFFSKMSHDKSHQKKQKKHLLGQLRGEPSGHLADRGGLRSDSR